MRNSAALELFPIVLSVELWGEEFSVIIWGWCRPLKAIRLLRLLLSACSATWFLLVCVLTVLCLLCRSRELIIPWQMRCFISSGTDSFVWRRTRSCMGFLALNGCGASHCHFPAFDP